MANEFVRQFFALSLYAFFMGFCFCDGFKLHILRKLAWFIVFLSVSVSVLKVTGEFDLTLILPLPCLLAILFGFFQKRESKEAK